MKKIINVALALIMMFAVSITFFGCNSTQKVKVINIKLTDEQYAYAVNKADTTLLAQVNEILTEITTDGTFQGIVNKYFGEGADTDAIEGIVNGSATAPNALIVVTNAEFSPFEYKNGEKFCGVDIEVAKIIADRLDRPLFIKDIDFDSVLVDLNAGLSHLAMAGLTVNADREKQVTFTMKYFNASQNLVVMESDTRFDACKTAADVETVLKSLQNKNIGFQGGTTGEFYAKGNESFGFSGFSNLSPKSYKNGGQAVSDLIAGNLDFVVIDELPANMIVNATNKKFKA